MVPVWAHMQMAASMQRGILLDRIVASTALAMWDPSDITSLFTTHTGETQVSADGDTVGLILDARPAYAAGFSTVGEWLASLANDRDDGVTGVIGTATAASYDTGTGAGSVSRAADVNNQSFVNFLNLPVGMYRIDIENTGATSVCYRGINGSGAITYTVAAGTRATFYDYVASTAGRSIAALSNSTTATFTVHSFKAVPGIHRAQASNTKRPLYRVSGALRSMQYDGLDDCLPTVGTVDLTATDAVTVCTGVRKLSDAAFGLLMESSASTSSNNGVFSFSAPGTALNNYGWRSKGTGAADAVQGPFNSPLSSVLTGLGDISSDTCILRVNGTQVATSTSDEGSGNFGNYIINFGSRNNGASAPFNGHEYRSVAQASLADAEIYGNYERWANANTAAY